VFGHRLAVEIRELAQGVSVGDPFAQFAIAAVLATKSTTAKSPSKRILKI
jgi:hypothetical protein